MPALTPMVVVVVPAKVPMVSAVVSAMVAVVPPKPASKAKAEAMRLGLRPSLSLASKSPGQESVTTRRGPAAHTQPGRPPECGGHHVEAEDEQEDGELHAEPAQLVRWTDDMVHSALFLI